LGNNAEAEKPPQVETEGPKIDAKCQQQGGELLGFFCDGE